MAQTRNGRTGGAWPDAGEAVAVVQNTAGAERSVVLRLCREDETVVQRFPLDPGAFVSVPFPEGSGPVHVEVFGAESSASITTHPVRRPPLFRVGDDGVLVAAR